MEQAARSGLSATSPPSSSLESTKLSLVVRIEGTSIARRVEYGTPQQLANGYTWEAGTLSATAGNVLHRRAFFVLDIPSPVSEPRNAFDQLVGSGGSGAMPRNT